MPRTVLCFGSHMKGDDSPFKLCRSLKDAKNDFNFVKCESPIDLMAYADQDELLIMDTVKGIDKVRLFHDVDDFLNVQSVSVHDMDLGTFLKVLDGMGQLKKVSIIGVPFGSKRSDTLSEIGSILSSALRVTNF